MQAREETPEVGRLTFGNSKLLSFNFQEGCYALRRTSKWTLIDTLSRSKYTGGLHTGMCL